MDNDYAAVGECIYCGAKNNLQDEHIIAYSLNGTRVLPKSSCAECARITGAMEGAFARGIAWPMRVALGFQTRRKKEVPTTFPLIAHREGRRDIIDVPVSEFPVILQLPIFSSMPGFIHGKQGEAIASAETVVVSLKPGTHPQELLQQLGRRYSADVIEVPRINPKMFARVLAKTSYALAVAEHGLSSIQDKYVVPGIRGEADDLGTWIGSSLSPLASEQGQHISQVQTWLDPKTGKENIVVLLKLFAFIPVPGYVIIAASEKGNHQ